MPPGPFPKPQWSSVCVGWMALLAAAATCPVGHLCYYVMAQICSADREALEKEGAQMAVCCHHRYSLRCSLLRSGELRERVMPRTGLRGVLRCQQPPSSLRLSRVLRSCRSTGRTPDFARQTYSEPGGSGKYNTLGIHILSA